MGIADGAAYVGLAPVKFAQAYTYTFGDYGLTIYARSEEEAFDQVMVGLLFGPLGALVGWEPYTCQRNDVPGAYMPNAIQRMAWSAGLSVVSGAREPGPDGYRPHGG